MFGVGSGPTTDSTDRTDPTASVDAAPRRPGRRKANECGQANGIGARTSNAEHPTSNIQHPTSKHRSPSAIRYQVSSLILLASAPWRGELPRARTTDPVTLPRPRMARPSICWLLGVGCWVLDVEFRCPVHPAPDPPVEDAVAVAEKPAGAASRAHFLHL
mgnify:CR=1 FL=1